jgi:hypothetical protein
MRKGTYAQQRFGLMGVGMLRIKIYAKFKKVFFASNFSAKKPTTAKPKPLYVTRTTHRAKWNLS